MATVARQLAQPEVRQRSELARAWHRFRSHRASLVGLVFILLLCAMAIGAPALAPYSPYAINTARMGEAPSPAHPFGLDEVGRDVFSRTIYGAQVNLLI